MPNCSMKLAWVPSFKINDFKQLGGDPVHGDSLVMTAGLPIGTGLHKQAADDLGLLAGTTVGSAAIDA
jgi:ribulose kinase